MNPGRSTIECTVQAALEAGEIYGTECEHTRIARDKFKHRHPAAWAILAAAVRELRVAVDQGTPLTEEQEWLVATHPDWNTMKLEGKSVECRGIGI